MDYPQPSSQEDMADVGMVKGGLEGGAANGLDPCTATEQRESNEEGMGGSRSGTNNQEGKTVEEQQGVVLTMSILEVCMVHGSQSVRCTWHIPAASRLSPV